MGGNWSLFLSHIDVSLPLKSILKSLRVRILKNYKSKKVGVSVKRPKLEPTSVKIAVFQQIVKLLALSKQFYWTIAKVQSTAVIFRELKMRNTVWELRIQQESQRHTGLHISVIYTMLKELIFLSGFSSDHALRVLSLWWYIENMLDYIFFPVWLDSLEIGNLSLLSYQLFSFFLRLWFGVSILHLDTTPLPATDPVFHSTSQQNFLKEKSLFPHPLFSL